MRNSHTYCDSPLGTLRIACEGASLTAVDFVDMDTVDEQQNRSGLLDRATQQLGEYFAGKRRSFDLPLAPKGTAFQKSVWNILLEIPFGKTVTYAAIAESLGDANKVRAVGSANGKNPIPIIIPCHRVVGSDNRLVGYSGGIDRKRFLLKHEGSILL